MERRETVPVQSGKEYNHLFPRAMLRSITRKKGATVADTIKFIPQVVNDTLFHTKEIAKVLKRDTVYETCKAIWEFVYDHIAYKKDEDGKEQIRSPARTWHDRGNSQGVDCDCYTVFISSILSNLKIKHRLRITKYKEDHFQHIYPIVPLKDGDYITIDCVVRTFNYEEPYTEKKDTNMDLEYLNGVYDSSASRNIDTVELVGLYDDREAMADLGRIFGKKGKFLDKVKNAIHKINTINPATVPIRMGILASMKLNVFKVAENLKWAYLDDAKARAKGIDIGKLNSLRKIKDKLEKIFFSLGGKPESFKKAILQGRGNRHHDVSGLGIVPDEMEGMDENTPLSGLLGDIYHDEISENMQGFGSLGVILTSATIAAASGILGTIAAFIKKIGNLFPKKTAPAETDTADNTDKTTDESAGPAPSPKTKNPAGETSSSSETADTSTERSVIKTADPVADESGADPSGDNAKSKDLAITDKIPEGSGGSGTTPQSFWQKNKKWLQPVAIGVGGLGLIYIGYRVVTGNKKTDKKPSEEAPALTGMPKGKKRGRKPKIKSNKKTAVALL
jgi:hypothetical protein